MKTNTSLLFVIACSSFLASRRPARPRTGTSLQRADTASVDPVTRPVLAVFSQRLA